MAKEILFKDSNSGQKISMQLVKEEPEVMIEIEGDSGNWFSFKSPKEMNDFIEELQELHDQLEQAKN